VLRKAIKPSADLFSHDQTYFLMISHSHVRAGACCNAMIAVSRLPTEKAHLGNPRSLKVENAKNARREIACIRKA